MKRLKRILGSGAAVALAAVPSTAFAQSITDEVRNPQRTSLGSIIDVLVAIIKYGLAFAAAIGAIFIVVNGYQYVLSAGNPEKVEKAKMGLTWSIGGFILAISAIGLIAFFQNALGFENPVDTFLPTDIGGNGGPKEIANALANLLFFWGGGVAVLFLILGGYRYVTSQGNQDLIDSAKRTITYAVIGLIIVMVAYLIFNLVYETLRVKPV